MNSKDYWAKRSALDMIEYMRTADQTATLIRETSEQAIGAVQKEIKGIFSAFINFGITETEARRILSADGTMLQRMRKATEKLKDPKQKQALLSAINSAGAYRWRIQRLEEVGKQITAQCRELYKAQLTDTTKTLQNVAEDAYYHTIFNVQKETGLAFSFAQFPKKQIDRILAFNWSGEHYSQRIWRNTEILAQAIKDEMLVSLLSGRSNAKTVRAIREQFNVNSFCAWRLVRTESSYVSNAAVSEGYKEADIEKYRYLATLDSRTSEKCAELDGKVFRLADKKVGTNFPPIHPFCRSTTLAEFGEETMKKLERRARDKDGKVMKVPADMTYREWADKYLDKSAESDIMKTRKADIVDGKNVVGIWQRRNNFDYAIDDIIDFQGYNGKPTIVYDRAEFDKCVEEDHFLAERTFCAEDQDTIDLYDSQLKAINGEDYFHVNCEAGGAQYGQGMYCAADYTKGTISFDKFEHEIKQYTWGRPYSKTDWMTLDPSAKVLDIPSGYDRVGCLDYVTRMYTDEYQQFRLAQDPILSKHWAEYQKGMDKVRTLYAKWDEAAWNKADALSDKLDRKYPDCRQLINDTNISVNNKNAGILAAEMGYDAINAQGHGTTGSYTVVLNRTKLIIFGGDDYEYDPK